MSWNEPGGDKKDPWSGRGDQKTPPDLDEAIRSLQEKLGNIFGGGRGGNRGPSGGASMKGIGFFIAGALLLWGLSGFYIVDEGNHGVETRFGKYIATTQSGLNWHFPVPIERVDIVNVRQQRFIEVGYRTAGSEQGRGSVPKEALMLTKDENIVDVRLAVQYQVKNAKDFLFNIVNPAAALKQVIESAQRGVVGSSSMDFVLTEGRSEIVAQIKKEIQDIMDYYQSGVQITSVNLQDVQPPEQVQNAFEDAIKSREDQQRLINEAEAYSNDVVPKARGAAARKTQEAEGYKEQVIAQAEGEASRFSQLLAEYKKAPDVTRKRLYIESMESVLAESNTVMIDVKEGNNLLYLPLDKMIERQQPSIQKTEASQNSIDQSTSAEVEEQPTLRTPTRGRDARGR
ncbi:MAG: FtsH protease activity modulator HflK [Methylobacter sp.]